MINGQNNTNMTEHFAFDPASNRVPVKLAQNKETDAKANNEDNRQKSPKSGRTTTLKTHNKYITYTYDTHGRLLYKTQTPLGKDGQPLKQSSSSIIGYQKSLQLEYNANNELSKSLSITQEGLTLTEVMTTYHYDAFGRRIAKHSQTRDKTKRVNKDSVKFVEQQIQQQKTKNKHSHYLWDSDKQLQEYSDTHVFTTIYEQNSFEPVARLMWLKNELLKAANDEIKNAKCESWKNEPELIPNLQVYHYHNDKLGTPNELTNNQGKVVWLADYEAWGNTAKVIWREQTINYMRVSQDELQPIRFQGQHYDEETGLHYNRFRYYDPDVGMFTSRDPIGLMGGDNVFQYAPNPTGFIDPLGLEAGTANAGAVDTMSLTKVLSLLFRGSRGIVGVALEPTKTSSCADLSCAENARWVRIAAQAHNASQVTEANRDKYELVFRGSDKYVENRIHDQTGFIMCDAAQQAYMENNDNFSKAIAIGKARDIELLRIYGSSHNLARTQSQKGDEFPHKPRSRFSVTTDLKTAIYYSRGDSVFASWVPKNILTESPLNKTTGGEKEYFIPVAYPMVKINPNIIADDLKH